MAKLKLPKGWHRGKPRAKDKVYKTSRECLFKHGRVMVNGYARWKEGHWHRHETWGNHFECDDFIWGL